METVAIIQCENNHYYDNSKFEQCPHCKKATAQGQDPSKFKENKTVAKFSQFSNGALNTPPKVDDIQKTVPKFFSDKNINPVAGWLVCLSGENKGRSFEVHIGKNFVGRSMKMDIHTNDEQISRENHFSVIYDPHSNDFFALEGNGITYFNGNLLAGAEKLKDGDEIEAGSSKYVFVPYCKEGREWNA